MFINHFVSLYSQVQIALAGILRNLLKVDRTT